MSELALLLLIVLAIYLSQCLVWAPQNTTVFRRSFGRHWKGHTASFLLEGRGIRLLFANPVFPGHGFALTQPLPFAVSPRGIAAGSPSPEGRERLEFLDFEAVRAFDSSEETVRANGKDLFRTACPEQAELVAAWLEQVRGAALHERADLIEAELLGRLRTRPVKRRLLVYEKETVGLRVFCAALLLTLFGVIPTAIAEWGLRRTWPALVLFLAVNVVAICVEFSFAHRCLYPADRAGRWTALLTLALSPPAAARANDVLLRNLMAHFDPLAVSRVLCEEQEFERGCRAALRALHFPLPSEVEPGPSPQEQTRAWFRQRLASLQEAFIQRQVKDSSGLLDPPAPESPQCCSYCPRCLTQFVFREGTCSDCSIPLQALPPTTT